MSRNIQVIYIGGSHRSGSTLLERMLLETGSAVSYGEIVSLWNAGLEENVLCSCGVPFQDCSSWRAVLDGEVWEMADNPARLDRVKALRKHCSRSFRCFRGILGKPLSGGEERELIEDYLEPVYRGIARVHPGVPVIDPSNTGWYLNLLLASDLFDVYLVHLVRDCRGVAYSYRRKKVRPELSKQGKRVTMATQSAFKSSKYWLLNNLMCMQAGKSMPDDRYLRVSYSDLVSSPKSTMEKIAKFSCLEAMDLEFFETETTVNLSAEMHSVMGNPNRFQSGPITISNDTEWREKLSVMDATTANIANRVFGLLSGASVT